MVVGTQADWLDTVADMLDRGEPLPVDGSTIEFAVKVALAYRAEAQEWRRLFDEVMDKQEAGS